MCRIGEAYCVTAFSWSTGQRISQTTHPYKITTFNYIHNVNSDHSEVIHFKRKTFFVLFLFLKKLCSKTVFYPTSTSCYTVYSIIYTTFHLLYVNILSVSNKHYFSLSGMFHLKVSFLALNWPSQFSSSGLSSTRTQAS